MSQIKSIVWGKYRNTLPFVIALIVAGLPLSVDVFERAQKATFIGEVNDEVLERNIYNIIIWSAVYLLAIKMWFNSPKKITMIFFKNKQIAAFVLLAMVSLVWSEFPLKTLSILGSLAGLFIIASVSAQTFSQNPLLILEETSYILGILQLLNILCVVFYPEWALDQDGRWRGWTGNANTLGSNSFCASWACLSLVVFGEKKKLILYMFLFVSILNLLNSDSITSIISFVMVAILILILKFYKSKIEMMTNMFLFGLIGVCIVVFIGLDQMALLMGRDSSFTGRTDAWLLAVSMFKEHPWFGFGFGDTKHFLWDAGFSHANFHNSYLEILIRLGLVGLTLFLIYLVIIIRKAIRGLELRGSSNWYLPLFIGVSFVGMAESVFLGVRMEMSLVFWVSAISFYMEQDHRNYKRGNNGV
jgi:O-antigen ligase